MAAAPRRHWGAGLLAAESFNLALFTYLLGCAGVLYALQRRAAAPPAERSKTPLRVAIAALALIVREVNALLTVGLVLVKRGGGGGGGGGGRAQGGALMLQTAVAGGMTVLAFAMVALVARGNERCMGGKDQDGYRGAMEEAVREVHRVAEGAGVEKLPVLPQAAAMGRV
ncbi:hypothetical protein EDC01DRAFT_665071 [Geopyxis carbonaria]|nr:hypothetical protein EDC01DRAFT_665071 [Geopyxis carbonaria]